VSNTSLTSVMGGWAGTGTPAEAEALRAELKVVNEKAVVLADAYCALEQDTAREVEAALDKQRVRLARLEEDNVKLRAALANDKKSEARLEKVRRCFFLSPPPMRVCSPCTSMHRASSLSRDPLCHRACREHTTVLSAALSPKCSRLDGNAVRE
jgi:hypothetical protein